MYLDTRELDVAPNSTEIDLTNAPELLAEIGFSSREIRDALPPLWIAPADNTRPEFE